MSSPLRARAHSRLPLGPAPQGLAARSQATAKVASTRPELMTQRPSATCRRAVRSLLQASACVLRLACSAVHVRAASTSEAL
eukprot:scaffold6694_cov101-Isochrysis_galbana.AAC.5